MILLDFRSACYWSSACFWSSIICFSKASILKFWAGIGLWSNIASYHIIDCIQYFIHLILMSIHQLLHDYIVSQEARGFTIKSSTGGMNNSILELTTQGAIGDKKYYFWMIDNALIEWKTLETPNFQEFDAQIPSTYMLPSAWVLLGLVSSHAWWDILTRSSSEFKATSFCGMGCRGNIH